MKNSTKSVDSMLIDRHDLGESKAESAAPAAHFRLHYLEAVLHVIAQAAQSLEPEADVFEAYPFLQGYREEFVAQGLTDFTSVESESAWLHRLRRWEDATPEHLPLRALARGGDLDETALSLLFAVGLIDEDGRFGALFETLQAIPGQRRPTVGLLNAWWRPPEDKGEIRERLRRLQELGLIQVVNSEAPRLEWALQPVGLIWDALRGQGNPASAPWLSYKPIASLKSGDELILPETLRQTVQKLPALIRDGEVSALLIRGPQNNGRKTLLAAIARTLGRGLIDIRVPLKADDDRWRALASLSVLLHALPQVMFELAPGETAELPRLPWLDCPLGVVLGRYGGLTGAGVEAAFTLMLEAPGPDARRALWAQSLGPRAAEQLADISEHSRLTSGNIHRIAALARTYARFSDHGGVTATQLREARRDLYRHGLDQLAARVATVGDWSRLAAAAETMAELKAVESRCRHRERLAGLVGAAFEQRLNAGVRILFSGPSGTGKTLAASVLASVLQRDLYRLDLAAVVNKYIGETEKNLSQVFARAEELDVILLLDEGDALLTQRTAVQSSNDRYANLETNYLLQRIESFDGILIITTNAADRIDSAFQRRMDVIIGFRPPDIQERWAIWQLHLPAAHRIGPELLAEVASRCAFTGGQIRNAALHAAVLAIEDGGIVTSLHLEAAVQREYRKAGAVCPLRQYAARS